LRFLATENAGVASSTLAWATILSAGESPESPVLAAGASKPSASLERSGERGKRAPESFSAQLPTPAG
jgi:hypothetical protein